MKIRENPLKTKWNWHLLSSNSIKPTLFTTCNRFQNKQGSVRLQIILAKLIIKLLSGLYIKNSGLFWSCTAVSATDSTHLSAGSNWPSAILNTLRLEERSLLRGNGSSACSLRPLDSYSVCCSTPRDGSGVFLPNTPGPSEPWRTAVVRSNPTH
jgi:hypothetical protein